MEWFVFALAAAFILGFETIAEKRVLKREHVVEFLAVVHLVRFLLLLPFIFKVSFALSLGSISLILIRSVFIVITVISFARALKHLPLSIVAPLSNFKPMFVLLFGFLLLGETINIVQMAGILIIIMGAYVLDSKGHIRNWHKPLQDLIKSKYIHYILIFSVFYSLSAVLSKVILASVDSFSFLFYTSFFGAIMYLLITFGLYRGVRDLKEGWNLAGIWILLIAILNIGAVYTSFLAFASIGAEVILIVPIIQLSTLIDIIFGGRLFYEKHLVIKTIACVLMILGVGLLFI